MGIFHKIKENHILLMVLTCVVPLLAVTIAVWFFDFQSKWLFWLALAFCMISHLWMMKSMHQGNNGGDKKSKEGGCH